MIFGTPVEKSRPKNDDDNDNKDDGDDDDDELNGGRSNFHPVQQVLAGQVHVNEDGEKLGSSKGLTFNAGAFRSFPFCFVIHLSFVEYNFQKFSPRSSLFLIFCHLIQSKLLFYHLSYEFF